MTMRSDHLIRHMKKHENKSNGIEEAGSSGSGVCEKVGKHKQAECKICLKTMRGDNLVRHMKTHEKKTNGIDEVNEKIEYNSNVNVTALENSMMNEENVHKIKEFVPQSLAYLRYKCKCFNCFNFYNLSLILK